MKKILILALGGEGGGTLTEWVVEAGLACGWPIQATSIPGVAQRTGATSYYIECLPEVLAVGAQPPPMCLAPLPRDLDLIVSSELLETARAVERGLSNAQRTEIISSTNRALTVEERTSMADGRIDSAILTQALQQGSLKLSQFNMAAVAQSQGTVVSAVMFGALAASGVLPFTREICHAVIAQGSSAERAKASVAGFDAGFDAVATKAPSAAAGTAQNATEPARQSLSLEQTIALGMARLTDYQDSRYAQQYKTIIDGFVSRDKAPFEASQEAARTLALWMAYEDVIRVADLKSRRSRFEQIRRDYKAKPNEPVVVRDFLKPGVDEIAAILPPNLAVKIKAWAQRKNVKTIGQGMQLSTSSVHGLLLMRGLANLRFMRRKSSRFVSEHELIARWVLAMNGALESEAAHLSEPSLAHLSEPSLARAIAELPSLIKGYSDTFERGRANFVRIFTSLVEAPALTSSAQVRATQIRAAFNAANTSSDGDVLFNLLGLQRPAPKEQVIHFARPVVRSAR